MSENLLEPSERVKGRTRTEMIDNNEPIMSQKPVTAVLKVFSTEVKGHRLNRSQKHK